MKTINFVFLFLTLILAACAHHRDVRPGADGTHKVVVSTDDKDEGTRQAIAQANHYCESINKSAAFVDEKSSYKGDMKEDDYKAGKKITKVAQVFGGPKAAIGNDILGDGYAVEMKFKCQ